MKNFKLLLIVPMLACLTGCFSLELNASPEPNTLAVKGVGSLYVSASGIDTYDKTIVQLRVFRNPQQPGEALGVKLWPFFDVGVGLVGARVKILPVEAGIGTLFYYPQPTGPYVDNPPADITTHEETTTIHKESTTIVD